MHFKGLKESTGGYIPTSVVKCCSHLLCYIAACIILFSVRIDFNFTSLYVVKVDDFFLHYIQKVQSEKLVESIR